MAVSGRGRIKDDKGLFFLCSVVEWVELRGKDFSLGFASKDETLGIMPRPRDASSDSLPYLFSNAIWNSVHLCCANKTFVCPGFPGSSAGKKSACNAEDPSSIPGLGRSPGEGIDYPLQDSWASLMAQIVKNLPAVWETWVQGGSQEEPLIPGAGYDKPVQYSCLENPHGQRSLAGYSLWGHKELDTS